MRSRSATLMAEGEAEVADLHGVRRVDWRFLLPNAELRRVLVTPPVVSRYQPGLAADGVEVVTMANASRVDGTSADAIAVHPDPALVDALRRRAPDLPIYVELDRSAAWDRRWWQLLRHQPAAAYLAVPGHDRRRAFVPLADRRALRWVLRSKGGLTSGLARSGLLDTSLVRFPAARLAPTRALVLSSDISMHSIGAWLEQRGLLEASPTDPSSHVLVTPRFSTSRHVVLLAGHGEPEVVVKTTRLAGSGVDSEATALRELWVATGGRDVGAPRLLAHERWGRRTVFAETALGGAPLTARDAARSPATTAAELTSWTLLLPRRGSSPAAERLSGLLTEPLNQMAEAGGAPEQQLAEATRSATAALAGVDLPVVFEHGDVSAPNLIRTNGGLALIDWELAHPAGLPAHDLFVALGFVARASSAAEGSEALEKLLLDAPPEWVRTQVGRYQRALDLDPEIMPGLFVCCWARVAAAHATRADVGGLDLAWWRRQPASRLWRAAIQRPAALDWMRARS